MDTVRYFIALLLIVSLPGSLCIWFLIHPLVHFWRKLGYRLTYSLQFIVGCGIAFFIFLARRKLLSVDFGTNYWFIGLSSIPLGIAVSMRRHIGRHLKFRTLVGLPEVAPDKYAQGLLTDGIYGRIRHPRYVQVVLALLAYAMIANYLATYLFLLLTCLWVAIIVPIEERELRERFGEAWTEYASRVPRFIPKRRNEQRCAKAETAHPAS